MLFDMDERLLTVIYRNLSIQVFLTLAAQCRAGFTESVPGLAFTIPLRGKPSASALARKSLRLSSIPAHQFQRSTWPAVPHMTLFSSTRLDAGSRRLLDRQTGHLCRIWNALSTAFKKDLDFLLLETTNSCDVEMFFLETGNGCACYPIQTLVHRLR